MCKALGIVIVFTLLDSITASLAFAIEPLDDAIETVEHSEHDSDACSFLQSHLSSSEIISRTAKIDRESAHGRQSTVSTSRPDETPHGRGGADIWNDNKPWSTVRRWHPVGVISNVYDGPVRWADVPYFDVYMLVALSVFGYPFLMLFCFLTMAVVVGMCMVRKPSEDRVTNTYLLGVDVDVPIRNRFKDPAPICEPEPESRCMEPSECDVECPDSPKPSLLPGSVPQNAYSDASHLPDVFAVDYAPPIVPRDSLTSWSQTLYNAWVCFCCAIPCLMVFGLPVVMTILSYPHPQEVNGILGLLTAAFVYHNGVYMVVFGCGSLRALEKNLKTYSKDAKVLVGKESAPDNHAKTVKHWVLVPQYGENVEVVAMALASISNSSVAKASIGVVLAMEEREKEASMKVNILKARFEGQFHDILVTIHPDGLPNDPPGKASNCKWAYDSLQKHLHSIGEDMSKVILTVADADSEFHESYFELLTERYMSISPELRNLRIYQAPILHVKNYHRQPGPVIVGTMFTTMQELSAAGDPNAVRFPYSTYSIPLELARRVGGWDAEWIGEDWHMGIKCFLLTVGISSVESLHLPIINYTPEDDTWLSTIAARWSQAKRHALGFSDVSYYFMMLPLIFSYAVSKSGQGGNVYLRAFWGMAGNGICMLIRMINTHVVLGVMTFYTGINIVLRILLVNFLSPDKHITSLFQRTKFLMNCVGVAIVLSGGLVTLMFLWAYRLVQHKIENHRGSAILFRNPFLHWLYGSTCFLLLGPFYFFALGVAVWRAAIKTLIQPTFEYEVAAKPVRQT